MFSSLSRAVRKTPLTDLLIVGHSHVECLGRALVPGDIGIRVIGLTAEKERLHPQTRALSVSDLKLADPPRLCLCLGGNGHSKLGLVNHPQPFCIDTAEPGKISIPRAVLREVLMEDLYQAFKLARILRKQFSDSPCLYLLPPPPIGDLEHIRAHPGLFRAKLSLGFSPPGLRRTLYEMQCDLYRALAAETGDPVLGAPDSVQTADGFLSRDYAHDDPTHGNTAYGRVMLDLVKQHFEKASAA